MRAALPHALVPVQAQPGQGVQNGVEGLLGVTSGVGVLDPEDEGATLFTEEEQALRASTAIRAAESGIARRRGLCIEVSFNSDYCTVFIAPTYSFYRHLSIKCRIYPSYFRKTAIVFYVYRGKRRQA